jgi:tRNA pseudouridine38-40 synthase
VTLSQKLTQFVLLIEYEGDKYHGFQLQANEPTIQAELERALGKLTGAICRVAGASRTDTGVHALGQVVSFRTKSTLPAQTFTSGLNYYLPVDIAVRAAYRVSDGFRVRSDAISREYNYYILNSSTRSPLQRRHSCRVGGELEIATMNRACRLLIGQHDFSSFATALGSDVKSMVRRMYKAEVKKEGDMVTLNMVASSFLPHQVRNTAGTLIRVGLGKMTLTEFSSIMEAHKPGLAGPATEAGGLCLMNVNYRQALSGENENI